MPKNVQKIGIDLKSFADKLSRGIENSAQDMADYILQEADKNLMEGDFSPAVGKGATNKGGLARSGRVINEGKYIKIVEFRAPYARDIEFGRDPKPVDDKAIVDWVWDKRAIFQVKDGFAAERVGRLIAASIRKNGTLPRPFFRRAIASLSDDKIKAIIHKNIQKAIK